MNMEDITEYYEIQDENQEAPETIENSEALKVPKPKLKRLQKRSAINYEDDDNENQDLNKSERTDGNSTTYEESGSKNNSDKKSRLERFAKEMEAMQISSPDPDTKKKRSKKRYSSDAKDNDEIYDFVVDDDISEIATRTLRQGNKSRREKKEKESSQLDDLVNKKRKRKEKAEAVPEERIYDPDIYTREEPDSPKREGDANKEYEQAMLALEEKQKSRRNRAKKDTSGMVIKTRNRLFDDIVVDFDEQVQDEDVHEMIMVEEEDIPRAKPEKIKDIGKLITNIEKYKAEKIRVPMQKSHSIMPENPNFSQPTPSGTQNSELPPPITVHHSHSVPNPALLTQDSNIPQENASQADRIVEIDMNKPTTTTETNKTSLVAQRSVDLKSLISKTKSIIPTEDDRLLEVEISVPHFKKGGSQTSQTLADNTLFVQFLSRQQSFVDKKSIVGQYAQSNKKRDLKSLAAELAQKHKEKKSGNVTLELIQSRFQVTDLRELEEQRKKREKERLKKQMEADGIEPEDEKDSDFNPEETKERENENEDGENELTFQGDFDENAENEENEKPLDIDDIKRLEEGEEAEGEGAEEIENEEGANPEVLEEEEEESKSYQDGQYDEENSQNRLMKEAAEEEFYGLEKFDDVKVRYDDDERSFGSEEGMTKREKKFKKLKTIGEKIVETLKRKEREKQEKEERRQRARERRAQMKNLGEYMDIEAELGSDKEENDDYVKEIDKKDEEENEEGLDEDLAELIDNTFQDGEYDEEALNYFLKDLMQEDRDNIKKVIQRSFNNKKRKRNKFEIDIDDDERVLKKMKRMEEIIKQLEEEENKVFGDGNGLQNDPKVENDDIFNEALGLQKFELLKTGHQIKKAINKRNSGENKQKDLFITDDMEVMDLLSKSNAEKKRIDLSRVGNSIENFKAATGGMMRQKTITKNSILTTKDTSKDINIFSNKLNKEVMNEYGSKEGLFASIERKTTLSFQNPDINNENSNSSLPGKNKFNKTITNQNNPPAVSSLGQLFSLKASELKGPSPNKSYIFKYRTKK